MGGNVEALIVVPCMALYWRGEMCSNPLGAISQHLEGLRGKREREGREREIERNEGGREGEGKMDKRKQKQP